MTFLSLFALFISGSLLQQDILLTLANIIYPVKKESWALFSLVFAMCSGISAFASSLCNPILFSLCYCLWVSEAFVWKAHMGNDGDGWLLIIPTSTWYDLYMVDVQLLLC